MRAAHASRIPRAAHATATAHAGRAALNRKADRPCEHGTQAIEQGPQGQDPTLGARLSASTPSPAGGCWCLAQFELEVQAIMAYNAGMQYTLRRIPKQLDAEVRRRAHEERKSMNRALLEALARGVGLQGEAQRQRDLSDIAGTWKKDAVFDRAIAEQDEVDEALWK